MCDYLTQYLCLVNTSMFGHDLVVEIGPSGSTGGLAEGIRARIQQDRHERDLPGGRTAHLRIATGSHASDAASKTCPDVPYGMVYFWWRQSTFPLYAIVSSTSENRPGSYSSSISRVVIGWAASLGGAPMPTASK